MLGMTTSMRSACSRSSAALALPGAAARKQMFYEQRMRKQRRKR